MTEQKHTRGPWNIEESTDGRSRGFIREAPDPETGRAVAICRVNQTGRRLSEFEANARLIAAAPDLLETAREAADMLLWAYGNVADPHNREGWSEDDPFLTFEKITAAIAKATGGAGDE